MIAGLAANPDGEWMNQMARNLTDTMDGFLRNATYLIRDRDPLFTKVFKDILKDRGVKSDPVTLSLLDGRTSSTGISVRVLWFIANLRLLVPQDLST